MSAVWAAIVVTYLLLGLFVSWLASVGHRAKYRTPLGWPVWVAGIVGWPVAFLIGMRRK